MKDIELRERGAPFTSDNTMFQSFHKCPRNFYWFMRRLDQRDSPPYFAWGRAFGAGLNTWHGLQGKEEFIPRLGLAIMAAQDEWEKDPPIESGDNNYQNLEDTLRLYATVYGEEEPWTMTYGIGELGFRFPITGTPYLYAGSIDAPIDWPAYGLLIREDKTTGSYVNTSGLDPTMTQWEFASQVTGYLWAAEQLIGETPFGAYMNVISKRKRKDPPLRFARLLVKKSSWELEKFMEDTVLLFEDIHREWDRWKWPKLGQRDPINCVGGQGRSACLYRRLCEMEIEPWDLEETYNFDQEFIWRPVWQPWEREGKNE